MSEFYRHIPSEEFEDIASRILYEDNHLLIFNKRSGEIVQGDKTGDEPLSEKMKAFVAQRDSKPGQVFMGVPHRLDRPVSGAMEYYSAIKNNTFESVLMRWMTLEPSEVSQKEKHQYSILTHIYGI